MKKLSIKGEVLRNHRGTAYVAPLKSFCHMLLFLHSIERNRFNKYQMV